MIDGLIQGQDAVMSFFKDDWIPFVCSSDVAIAITANKIAVRAPGDGTWKKYTYQDAEYTITLSGLLKFDDDNFTGWDLLNNQLGFVHVQFRCSFDDQNGNVRSVQGFAMIETSTLTISSGALVKNDFNLTGNGKLIIFDGLVPCPTVISTITITGQSASDGIIHVAYTYTGSLYQIKYRIDDAGDYAYALAGVGLDIPGLSLGNHTIEIIPVCLNGFEGTGLIQDFMVTQALTCTSVITAITVTTGAGANATNTHTGAATQMQYRIDGGVWIITTIGAVISLTGLSAGAHTIEEVPICSNGLTGTGMVQSFTIPVQPSQSVITYDFEKSVDTSSCDFRIYVNGVLTISETATASGSLVVPIGQTVIAEFSASTTDPSAAITGELKITDVTTIGIVTDQTNTARVVGFSFSFVPNGDHFLIQQLVS